MISSLVKYLNAPLIRHCIGAIDEGVFYDARELDVTSTGKSSRFAMFRFNTDIPAVDLSLRDTLDLPYGKLHTLSVYAIPVLYVIEVPTSSDMSRGRSFFAARSRGGVAKGMSVLLRQPKISLLGCPTAVVAVTDSKSGFVNYKQV